MTFYHTVYLEHFAVYGLVGILDSLNFLSWLWKTEGRHLLVDFGTELSETKEAYVKLSLLHCGTAVTQGHCTESWQILLKFSSACQTTDRRWGSFMDIVWASHKSMTWPLCSPHKDVRCPGLPRTQHVKAHVQLHSTDTSIKRTRFQCATSGDVYFISLCPELSWSPEKTLPPDPAGMARMKQHERWAGMLLEKAGVQQHRHWARLEMWRGSPFVGEVYLWENSQAAQAEVRSGLFSYSSTKTDCAALFYRLYGSSISCVGSLLPWLLTLWWD